MTKDYNKPKIGRASAYQSMSLLKADPTAFARIYYPETPEYKLSNFPKMPKPELFYLEAHMTGTMS